MPILYCISSFEGTSYKDMIKNVGRNVTEYMPEFEIAVH